MSNDTSWLNEQKNKLLETQNRLREIRQNRTGIIEKYSGAREREPILIDISNFEVNFEARQDCQDAAKDGLIFSNPLKIMEVTSPFGHRTNAIPNNHEGTDYRASIKTFVYASEAGTITMALIEPPSNISKSNSSNLRIDHGKGWETRYIHLDSFVVKEQEIVTKGQLIGYSGNRKNTIAHLHFEIRKNNVPKNPENFLKR